MTDNNKDDNTFRELINYQKNHIGDLTTLCEMKFKQIADLKAQRDDLEKNYNNTLKDFWKMDNEIVRLEAENEKLKIQRDGWQTIANKEVNKKEVDE